MNIKPTIMVAVLLPVLTAGCYHVSGAGGPMRLLDHQDDLDCPADLHAYCGGWDVYATDYAPTNEHVVVQENFVVGKKNLGGGNQQLALFPRDDLLIRWNPPNGRVDLKEITAANGDILCLVGRVHINTHSANHNWHGIILTVDKGVHTPMVGDEDRLDLCMTVQTSGAWPSDCTCEYPPNDPRQHGGRAHSYD